ncbi:MAG: hypothetical protein ACXVUE_10665 [Solirubrobacteraceae bacterium]
MTVYPMIAAEKAQGTPVSLACELLGVSRSGFTKWERRARSDRALQDAWLTEKVKQIHLANRGVYGAPGIQVSRPPAVRPSQTVDVETVARAAA